MCTRPVLLMPRQMAEARLRFANGDKTVFCAPHQRMVLTLISKASHKINRMAIMTKPGTVSVG